MEIIINNQQAILEQGTSFDFIAENRLFTGSDSYTLTITFPLRGCAQNIAIFGHIHRAEVAKNKVVFDCEIRDRDFYRSGTITITEISDVEVKTQFLEGRSEQNFDETFDDIYLNELDLGYPTSRVAVAGHCMDDMRPYPDNFWIPLPWVNNTSGNIQNEMVWSADKNEFIWPHEKPMRKREHRLCRFSLTCCISFTGYASRWVISGISWRWKTLPLLISLYATPCLRHGALITLHLLCHIGR